MASTARGQGSCIYRVWGIRCGASAAAWKNHKKGRLAREKRAAVLGSSGARQAARKMVRMSCCACLCVGKVRRRRAGKSRRDRHPERERLQRREHGAGQAGSWYRGRKHRAAAGRGLRVSDKEQGLSSPRLADTHESTGQGHRQGGAAIEGKPAGRSGRVGRQLGQKRRRGRELGEKQAGGRGKPGVGSCWAGCWGENRLPGSCMLSTLRRRALGSAEEKLVGKGARCGATVGARDRSREENCADSWTCRRHHKMD